MIVLNQKLGDISIQIVTPQGTEDDHTILINDGSGEVMLTTTELIEVIAVFDEWLSDDIEHGE